MGQLRRHHLHRRGAAAWPSGRPISIAASSACWRCPALVNDVTFKVTRGVTRPVWEPDAGTMALYDKARGIASGAGRSSFRIGSAGGGSDGNFTGAMGIPTLDGLASGRRMRIRSTNISKSTASPSAAA